MNSISLSTLPIGGINAGLKARPANDVTATGGGNFGNAIEKALGDVSASQNAASTLSREFQLENPNVSLEETMIALQKASLGFQSAVQVRNKLVTAYNDIMNMPV